MLRSCSSADGLVHQCAAKVITASVEARLDALVAHLYPACLYVIDEPMQGQACHRVHKD